MYVAEKIWRAVVNCSDFSGTGGAKVCKEAIVDGDGTQFNGVE